MGLLNKGPRLIEEWEATPEELRIIQKHGVLYKYEQTIQFSSTSAATELINGFVVEYAGTPAQPTIESSDATDTASSAAGACSQIKIFGINTDYDFIGRGISKNLSYANAYNIPFVIIVGKNELSNDSVKIRDMKSGKETTVKISGLVSFFEKKVN